VSLRPDDELPLPTGDPAPDSALPRFPRSGQPGAARDEAGLDTASSSSASAFKIELRGLRSLTKEQRAAFEKAAERWSEVIVNDLNDVTLPIARLPRECVGDSGGASQLQVDDLTIVVRLTPIDGVGGILGAAGPCVIRSTDGSPSLGLMNLDIADVEQLDRNGQLAGVVLHEMGHVLGLGTLWGAAGLLREPSLPDSPGADTHFVGARARAAFDSITGATYTGARVPVENSAQEGSADGHWRELVFGNELMSPAISPFDTTLPLSIVTIGALEDLGFYQVDYSAADPLSAPITPRVSAPTGRRDPRSPTSVSSPALVMEGCQLHRPSMAADADGTMHRLM
jgi:hypothetical protein